jgi:hypothetical protein
MRAMRAQLHRATIFDWLEAILARCADLMDAGNGLHVNQERRRLIQPEAFGESETAASGSTEETPWGDMWQ